MTRSGQAGVGTTDLPVVNTWQEVQTVAVLIDRGDPRGASAVKLALQADQWQRVGSAWRVPSRSRTGTTYVATSQSCQCKDFRFNERCAHAIAVALIDQLHDETAAF